MHVPRLPPRASRGVCRTSAGVCRAVGWSCRDAAPHRWGTSAVLLRVRALPSSTSVQLCPACWALGAVGPSLSHSQHPSGWMVCPMVLSGVSLRSTEAGYLSVYFLAFWLSFFVKDLTESAVSLSGCLGCPQSYVCIWLPVLCQLSGSPSFFPLSLHSQGRLDEQIVPIFLWPISHPLHCVSVSPALPGHEGFSCAVAC